ncbi:hypothetical protein Pma05_34260 [Plantactinospora mayteni]|uniref:Uncharacterized protein n=1 Tax=Plantactinospora mayteni TaxID=566021 RepID=A0ABQ4EQB7_9ACTN|nr:hypothetical protein Pma05_34260 [Plantactinospora mayteni]
MEEWHLRRIGPDQRHTIGVDRIGDRDRVLPERRHPGQQVVQAGRSGQRQWPGIVDRSAQPAPAQRRLRAGRGVGGENGAPDAEQGLAERG